MTEFFLKMPIGLLQTLLPLLMIRLGNDLKNLDSDSRGMDDAGGDFLIAAAPAVTALFSGQESAFKKACEAIYTTLGNYLKKGK